MTNRTPNLGRNLAQVTSRIVRSNVKRNLTTVKIPGDIKEQKGVEGAKGKSGKLLIESSSSSEYDYDKLPEPSIQALDKLKDFIERLCEPSVPVDIRNNYIQSIKKIFDDYKCPKNELTFLVKAIETAKLRESQNLGDSLLSSDDESEDERHALGAEINNSVAKIKLSLDRINKGELTEILDRFRAIDIRFLVKVSSQSAEIDPEGLVKNIPMNGILSADIKKEILSLSQGNLAFEAILRLGLSSYEEELERFSDLDSPVSQQDCDRIDEQRQKLGSLIVSVLEAVSSPNNPSDALVLEMNDALCLAEEKLGPENDRTSTDNLIRILTENNDDSVDRRQIAWELFGQRVRSAFGDAGMPACCAAFQNCAGIVQAALDSKRALTSDEATAVSNDLLSALSEGRELTQRIKNTLSQMRNCIPLARYGVVGKSKILYTALSKCLNQSQQELSELNSHDIEAIIYAVRGLCAYLTSMNDGRRESGRWKIALLFESVQGAPSGIKLDRVARALRNVENICNSDEKEFFESVKTAYSEGDGISQVFNSGLKVGRSPYEMMCEYLAAIEDQWSNGDNINRMERSNLIYSVKILVNLCVKEVKKTNGKLDVDAELEEVLAALTFCEENSSEGRHNISRRVADLLAKWRGSSSQNIGPLYAGMRVLLNCVREGTCQLLGQTFAAFAVDAILSATELSAPVLSTVMGVSYLSSVIGSAAWMNYRVSGSVWGMDPPPSERADGREGRSSNTFKGMQYSAGVCGSILSAVSVVMPLVLDAAGQGEAAAGFAKAASKLAFVQLGRLLRQAIQSATQGGAFAGIELYDKYGNDLSQDDKVTINLIRDSLYMMSSAGLFLGSGLTTLAGSTAQGEESRAGEVLNSTSLADSVSVAPQGSLLSPSPAPDVAGQSREVSFGEFMNSTELRNATSAGHASSPSLAQTVSSDAKAKIWTSANEALDGGWNDAAKLIFAKMHADRVLIKDGRMKRPTPFLEYLLAVSDNTAMRVVTGAAADVAGYVGNVAMSVGGVGSGIAVGCSVVQGVLNGAHTSMRARLMNYSLKLSSFLTDRDSNISTVPQGVTSAFWWNVKNNGVRLHNWTMPTYESLTEAMGQEQRGAVASEADRIEKVFRYLNLPSPRLVGGEGLGPDQVLILQ